MRILLVSPGAPASLAYQPPLGLAYILSRLRKNGFQEITFFDRYEGSEALLRRTIRRERPDLVGIQCQTPTRHLALGLARIAKQERPEARVVFGGVHATFLARQLLEHYDEVDYVVRGEGESPMLNLARRLAAGEDADGVAGVAFRKGGDIVENAPAPPTENLDRLPFPAYFEHYTVENGVRKKTGEILTARGCGAACNYCSVPNFWGRPRFRSAENVVDEIEHLVRHHGVQYVWIADDTFTVDQDRARRVCEEILRRGLPVQWRCATRADCVSKDLLDLMARAGCIRVSYGVESGSPEILRTIHKNVSPDQAEQAIRWSKDAGMIIEACFMVGNRGESQKTIDQTKALIRRLRPEEYCVSAAVYLFPGTPLYRYAEKQGLVDESVWLRDDPVVPYTAEQPIGQLARWQAELMHELGMARGFWNYLKHVVRVARHTPLRRLPRAGYHFLRTNLRALFSGPDGKRG